jgi:hypothetical protein
MLPWAGDCGNRVPAHQRMAHNAISIYSAFPQRVRESPTITSRAATVFTVYRQSAQSLRRDATLETLLIVGDGFHSPASLYSVFKQSRRNFGYGLSQ